MQSSISKLAFFLIGLLITATVGTTTIGLFVLRNDYRSLENHHEAEAQDTVRNAASSIRNQVQFYQGILHLLSTKAEVANLLEFADTEEITHWSGNLRRLLPGTLGTALVSARGELYGSAREQRVGPACLADMQQMLDGKSIDFPPIHVDVRGLEHFDLLAHVSSPEGENTGTVFVSFRLGIIRELLENMSADLDRFELRDSQGAIRVKTGWDTPPGEIGIFRTEVPDTPWTLVLRRPVPPGNTSFAWLLGADLFILSLSAVLIVVLIRRIISGFESDMGRIHAALTEVIDGHYHPNLEPTSLKEADILLPDIERLALRLQSQRNQLRRQSLSDPLTGVFNRRYFDMMLAHLHEQSRRQKPAHLIIIDLNDFKHVNDKFGHASGDKVLQNTARYLLSRVRATDIVARLGGDEFGLIITNMPDELLSEWITVLLHDFDHRELEQRDESPIFCQLSVGAAAIDLNHYPTPEHAFSAADQAMYSVKQRRAVRHSRFTIAQPHDAAPTQATAGPP